MFVKAADELRYYAKSLGLGKLFYDVVLVNCSLKTGDVMLYY